MNPQKRNLHALVFPFPLQGHISPLLQLSQYLADSLGFLVTFVNTEYNHAAFMEANKNKQRADQKGASKYCGINMVGLSDGLPLHAERKPSDLSKLVQSMPLHMAPLLQQIISDSNQTSSPITCIIADLFLPWLPNLAKQANVPVFIGFHASSIAQFSSLYHIPLLVSSGQLNTDGSANVKKVTGIPGVLDIPVSTYPWITGDPARREATFKGLASVHDDTKQLDAVIFNSFTELEKGTVEALAEDSKTKMLPIGPMLLLNETGRDVDAGRTDLSPQDKECLDWLDSKPKGSVLYIAFGTTAWLDMKELHALALGIEASQVTFLWVLRADLSVGSESACLPEGFVERTMENAHFMSWAPQPLVLSHPSVGGFLTHGGWNSALEAICHGVPMLTWPDFWDQKMHSEQVISQWKIGLPLRRDDGKPVEQQEVEKLVRCLMSGKEGQHLRERVATLKSKATRALAHESGSSYNNIRQVVQLLEKKCSGAGG